MMCRALKTFWHQVGDVNARIQAAEASVRAAELDVGYCRVSAPFDAYVTNLNIAVGEYARQGQQIFALVDNRAWYVLANFRETYMSSIKPGMEADVYLLSYPGRRFRGVVQGIGWANKPQDGAHGGRAAASAADAELGPPRQPVPGSRPPRGAATQSAPSGWEPRPSSPSAVFRPGRPRPLRRGEVFLEQPAGWAAVRERGVLRPDGWS